jgi:hypothetical protein
MPQTFLSQVRKTIEETEKEKGERREGKDE